MKTLKRLLAGAVMPFVCTAALFAADNNFPTILSVSPPAGTVNALTNITVVFSEPVSSPGATDLLLNGVPSTDVVGSNTTYTFTVDQPPYGVIQITWDGGHSIFDEDEPPKRFNHTGAGATWQYNLVDNIPPTIAALTPAAGVTIRQLAQVEVQFSELVAGVDAADLIVNGAPATNLVVLGAGRYRFQFPAVNAGSVNVQWSGGHGIRDFANPPNLFAGGSWSYTIDPGAGLPDVRINEFLTINDSPTTPDDWVEIWNRSANTVNLAGWSLTDDADDPGKWTFPATNIGPGQYLVVFTTARDIRTPGARLHTNFKLNPSGEYLALFNAESPRVAMTEFYPEYPEQRNNISYGYDPAGNLKYFNPPTQGAVNGNSAIAGIVPTPHFNVERGLFDDPFTLILTAIPGATIRYTLDGSEPTTSNGEIYTGPMQITNTTVFRAIALKPDVLPSVTVTHTYVFLDQVLKQPANPSGFPSTWGTHTAGGFPGNVVPSDYEMDPEIVTNATYSPLIKDAMKSLPVVSLSIKVDDMFGPVNGIYTHPLNRGTAWEKRCSLEMFFPDGSSAFQVNAGVQVQGNAAREPQKQPKHPMRVTFKGDYGPSRLKYQVFPDSPLADFDTLIMRADFNFSWLHWDGGQRPRGQRTRDSWCKDTMRAMGNLSSHNRYVHLYIDGLYWGVYDFAERPDAAYAASYLGGEKEEYDVINEGATVDGDMTAYNAMLALTGMDQPANYNQMKFYLDMTQFMDYMLLHFYVGHQDWGLNKNWYTVRKRDGSMGFKYVPWDQENILPTDLNYNRVSNTDVPSSLHTKLLASTQYRLDFADRVQKHLFNGGALTTNEIIQRWLARASQVDQAIICESARWGDYRRDVHRFETAGPFELFTRNNQWLAEQNRLVGTFFPQRGGVLLNQLRTAGLYPNMAAPTFNNYGGGIARGFNLTMAATNTIYYTTDGVDPRVAFTGAIAGSASVYSAPVVLDQSTVVKARALTGTNWSALVEAVFTVDPLRTPLRITEIMYNPVGGDAYEFIELQNIGVIALDVGSYSFEGIDFIFPPLTSLAPGQVIVLGSMGSINNWTNRYPGVTAFGRFDGKLDNGGEKLAIKDSGGKTIYSVDYDDGNGWPVAADGFGPSLEIIDVLGDPDDPANWRASAGTNGTPGTISVPPPGGAITLNEIMADNLNSVSNETTRPDWIELYNSGEQAVNLGGWSLTDDGNARKFVFPPNTMIQGSNFLVVWCDDTTNTTPGLHTGFSLGRNGETITLYNPQTNRVDAVSFGLQITDLSVGRISGKWVLNQPTPNGPNTVAATTSITNVSINEWLANTLPGQEDWVELYNASATQPVSLQGAYLGTTSAVFQISSLSFIAPGGFVQLFADELAGPDHLDFKLAAAGGAIILYDVPGAEVSRVTYPAASEGVTQGRFPDGTGPVRAFPGSASPRASNYVINYAGATLNEVLAINDASVTNAFGATPDYLELRNTNGAPFDLSGMRLSRSDRPGVGGWTIPSGVSVPAFGHLLIWCDDSRLPSSAAEADLNTGFDLDGESDELFLINTNGNVVDSVEWGFQVADLSIGKSGGVWRLTAPTPGQPNAAPATLAPPTGLKVNEWLAQPLSGADWFEIYNSSNQPVALSGLFTTDYPGSGALMQHAFAPLSFIAAKGFVKVIADGDPSQGRDHATFSLNGDGESIRIFAPGFGVVDTIFYGAQEEGVSQGRLPDGENAITSFPGFASPAESNYRPLGTIVINEVLTHADAPLEDAIELRNLSPGSIDIGGWYLSNSRKDFKKFRIPDGTLLPAGGFLVFYQNQFGSGPSGFILSSSRGGSLVLSVSDAAGNLTGERVFSDFGAAANGVSFGQYPTSVGSQFVPMAARSFGVDNPGTPEQFRTGTGKVNGAARVGPVVINEIMYHPPNIGDIDNWSDEYIELHNISGSPVALHNWSLRGAVDFLFPAISIPANGYLVVVSFDPASDPDYTTFFRSQWGIPTSSPMAGPFSGHLDNEGDNLDLFRPDTAELSGFVPQLLVERIDYSNRAPWPVSGDGDGNSVQRQIAVDFGNEPLNWVASAPSAGGGNNAESFSPILLEEPSDIVLSPGSTATFFVKAFGTSPLTYQWRYNGSSIGGATSAVLEVPNTDAGDEGLYTVVVANSSGSITSSPAALTLLSPPVITSQPQGFTTNAGANVSLTVGVQGSGPFSFQWRVNGGSVSGATSQTLVFAPLKMSDAGQYSVLVSNPAGQVASAIAIVEVFRGVEVLTHPQSYRTNVGSNVVFTVSASGTGPLRYQWRFNGNDLPGQTNISLSLTNIQLEHTGDYAVLVSDSRSAVLSQAGTLVALLRPFVTEHPLSATIPVGSNLVFRTAARGTLPISYRWRRNNGTVTNIILHQTNCALSLLNVQTNLAGIWNVAVTNSVGLSLQLSSNAYLIVVIPPTNQVVSAGTNATLTIEAMSGSTTRPPLQWFFNGTNINNATNSTLTITNIDGSNVGLYSVNVTNPLGQATAFYASLALAASDADGDGIPDDWEDLYGLDRNSAADANIDSDGDTMTNREEYIAGTNPKNNQSYLKLDISGSAVQFLGVDGKTYSILRSLVGPEGPWNVITNMGPISGTQVIELPVSGGDPKQFYRLRTPREQ